VEDVRETISSGKGGSWNVEEIEKQFVTNNANGELGQKKLWLS
jgi:hypothetical protein